MKFEGKLTLVDADGKIISEGVAVEFGFCKPDPETVAELEFQEEKSVIE